MNTIRFRVTLLCVGLILLTALAMQLSHGWFIHKHNQQQLHEQVANASHFLHQYINSRESNLRYAAEVIIQDFGFKQAVATDDVPTISSMLSNHAERIHADLMLIINNNGELIASNDLNFSQDVMSQINWRVLSANAAPSGDFIEINKRLYRWFSLPVKTPHQIANSIIAFEINPALLEELKNKTGLDIVFISQTSDLFLTTLDLNRAEFDTVTQSQNFSVLWWQRPAYLMQEVTLKSVAEQQIQLYLMADLSLFYKVYDQLKYSLLLLTLFIVFIAVILSTLLARRLANPLSNLYQDLIFRATHDQLTGIFNRYAAIERITDELKRSSRGDKIYCVALCDIDNFKRINDTYGHGAGDEVLKRFAARLKTTLRPYDVLGRFGGEEFLIALQLKPEEATASFERLRAVIADDPIAVGTDLVPVTMSCGVCLLWPEEDIASIDVILQAADTALYKAKDHGRNQVIFTHVPQFPVVEAEIDDDI